MSSQLLRKECFKQIIIYFFLTCTFFSLNIPCRLEAEMIIVTDQEEEKRTKAAYIITGATVVALGIGIGYVASCSSGKHCHSDSYSRSSYSRSSYYSSYSHESHPHSSHSDHDSSSYSIFNSDYGSSSSGGSSFPNDPLDPQFPLRHRKTTSLPIASKETHHLTGLFTVNPHLPLTLGSGNLTVFVYLPDGTRQNLGCLSLTGNANSSVSYGPFYQIGTYIFGVSLEQGILLPPQTCVCSLEIDVNKTKIHTHDFMSPFPLTPHEITPYSYTLNE